MRKVVHAWRAVGVRSREARGAQKFSAHQLLHMGLSWQSGCMMALLCKPPWKVHLSGSFLFLDKVANQGLSFSTSDGPGFGTVPLQVQESVGVARPLRLNHDVAYWIEGRAHSLL